MKKAIIKAVVFIMTFVVALFVISRIMNKGHNNMTMEMAGPGLPVISMEKAGIVYNNLYGYTQPMDVALLREQVTVLGENRDSAFTVHTYGCNVTGIYLEVRSTDGSRLIENSEITDYQLVGNSILGRFAVKDLIEQSKEYVLVLLLELDGDEQVRYYTRMIWDDSLHEVEKLQFVLDFHDRLYNREAARELTKYMETNYALEDNSSFHKVNIHSSFKQITWGDMEVEQVGDSRVTLKEIASQTASVVVESFVQTHSGNKVTAYRVSEVFRVRYTADRMYLLDYDRTMNQIPDVSDMYANDKILFGITDENVPFAESVDGNVVVFTIANKLCSYNMTTNKLAMIFSFYDEKFNDERCLNDNHSIKILDVDEGGNISFAVYGYMNRGRHEGQVGIQINVYNSNLNTNEELIYIPYDCSFSVLQSQMEQLLYLNRDNVLYLLLDDAIHRIDLTERKSETVVTKSRDDSMLVSGNHKILVWQEEMTDGYCRQLNVRNLSDDTQISLKAQKEEVIRPLGFMGEDILYGVARQEDVARESFGRLFFPMYKLCICNAEGKLLKEYQQENIYITGCKVEDNQITLERLLKDERGNFQTAAADHITNNAKEEPGKNRIVVANIDVYEKYVQLQVKNTINTKSIQILTPKEVVFEEGRKITLSNETEHPGFYVYEAGGRIAVYYSPANAIAYAYQKSGCVTDGKGNIIWIKGNRVSRNQIMAIGEPEKAPEGESLAVCLDTIFAFEGLVRNSAYLLGRGQSVSEILANNLDAAQILDLTGCPLDAVLYYVNRDIPVLVLLEDGEAVLLTGFNELNVVIFEPSKGKLYKNGMNDTTKWLEENGNSFITYIRKE